MRPRLLAEYRYDALGRRVYRRLARKDDSGRDSIARYLYEGFSVEPVARLALESAGSDDDGAAKTHADSTSRYRYLEPNRPGVLPDGHARVNANARVVLRRGGALVAEVGNQAGRTRYFGLDALRSVVATYGRRGEMVRRQRYDAFGATLSHAQRGGSEREAANGAIPFDVRFGFAGKLRDAATGWYDFGYRDYDPTLGRFTSVDPIKDGGNWYAYVANDPVNRRDPTGLFMVVGPGLGYNRNTDRYQTTDARNLSEKSRIRITRNGDTDAFYDDSMQVEVDALVLTRTPVQSEADWGGFEDQTLPEGEYTGHLLDYSYSYDDPILLVNDDAVTESGHRVSVDFGALIHPNEFTNPERDDEYNQDQPWSKGCQITPGADVYGAVRDEVERLGYEYRPGSTFTEDGETWGSPQTIPVSIKNR
jgi:RHS repeat-associated protein